MNVFRLHIRPKGGLADPDYSFAYCLQEQVLGVGWQAYPEKPITTWQEYETEASQHHDDLSRVRYLKDRVRTDDLIWTRSPMGEYYLAKVSSGWEYYTNKRAEDADIVNVVRCQILKVRLIDEVPGKVVACFRPTRCIQGIAGDEVRYYSQDLWNTLSRTAHYSINENSPGSIFAFLSSEATEDVVFVYLQTKGWLIIPNSRKADTMSFEFYLIHRETKQRAVAQIKTGNTVLCVEEWKNRAEHVFLFQSNGLYLGEGCENIVCISPGDILDFMSNNREIFPANIIFWIDHVAAMKARITRCKFGESTPAQSTPPSSANSFRNSTSL